MTNPKRADVLVRGGERQAVFYVFVGEAGGIEVNAVQLQFFGKGYPRRKVAREIGVPVDFSGIVSQQGIAGMQIQPLFAGHQGKGLSDVGHQLLGGAGTSGIVARGLNPTRRTSAAVKADHVIALPAVNADGNPFQGVERLFRPDTEGIQLLNGQVEGGRYKRGIVGFHSHFSLSVFLYQFREGAPCKAIHCAFRLPSAVASIGSATTFF